MADRQGFEPWRRSPAYTLSRRAPSTTRPPVRGRGLARRSRGLQVGKRMDPSKVLAVQMDVDPAVLATLLFDLAKAQGSDLTGARDVGAAAGL